MNRHVLLLLCAVLPIALASPAAAHAQTAPIPPSGGALLPAALIATALRGSEHLSGTLGVGVPGGPPATIASVTGDGALSLQPRLTLRITPRGAGAALLGGAPISLAIKGKYLATRTGKKKWSCTNLAAALLNGKSTGQPLPIAGLTLPSLLSLPKLQKPVDLGADTINGVAVWHLQIKSVASNATPATVDIYVNQADMTFDRLVVASILPGQSSLGLSLSLDFGQYGKPVKVTLPAICKAKPARKSG